MIWYLKKQISNKIKKRRNLNTDTMAREILVQWTSCKSIFRSVFHREHATSRGLLIMYVTASELYVM